MLAHVGVLALPRVEHYMPWRRSKITPFRAIKIILAPSRRPTIQILATFGIAISALPRRISNGLASLAPDQKEVLLDLRNPPYIDDTSENPPRILSYRADGKPGGSLFNADLSSRKLSLNVPDSPYEKWMNRLLFTTWISAWLFLFGCLFTLHRI